MRWFDEMREKISEATREAMRRPEIAEKHRFACKNRIVTEEGRKKQSIAQKKRYESTIFKTTSVGNYIPDFELTDLDDSFIEVKGYLRDVSARKMDEFVSGGHKLYVIDRTNIEDLSLSKVWQRQGLQATSCK
jgi:hypothetical protein